MTTVTGQAEARRSPNWRSGILRQVWEHRADYVYVLPAIVVMLIVIAYPIYYTIDLSFFKTPPGPAAARQDLRRLRQLRRPSSPATCSGASPEHADLDAGLHHHLVRAGLAAALALHREFIGRGVSARHPDHSRGSSARLPPPTSGSGSTTPISASSARCWWSWGSPAGHRTSSTASTRCCPR